MLLLNNMKKLFPIIMTMLIVATPLSNVSAANDYVVKKGDTLWGISQEKKLSIQDLMSWNKLTGYSIAIGQKLTLTKSSSIPTNPSSTDVTHKVVKGDTLYSISAKYKVSVQSLMTLNQLKTTVLKVDQMLKVGSKAGEVVPTPPDVITTTMAQTTSNLHIRKTASTSGISIVVVPKGSAVKVLSKTGSWWKIDYKGNIGYSSSAYLKITGTSTSIRKS